MHFEKVTCLEECYITTALLLYYYSNNQKAQKYFSDFIIVIQSLEKKSMAAKIFIRNPDILGA